MHDKFTERVRKVMYLAREEAGVLPLPWAGPLPRPLEPPLAAGYGGGFFHPVTGYSLPVAVRLASLVASLPPDLVFGSRLDALARRHRAQRRFAHLLNWLLFRAYPAKSRWLRSGYVTFECDLAIRYRDGYSR